MKRTLIPALLGLLALAGPTGARADLIELGTDPDNDWGIDVEPTLQPLGDALGQELVGAAIDNSELGLVKFIIRVKSLPEGGGVPEGSRYIWEMRINDSFHMELDGKFTNYSRGACDPTAGNCGPEVTDVEGDPTIKIRRPRDPGTAPFAVRGDCTVTGAYVCREIALVHATFEPATGEITIPVPVSVFGVQGCPRIAPDVNADSFDDFANVVAVPSAFFSSANGPYDWIAFEDYEEATVIAC